MLNVGVKTVRRRMKEHGISVGDTYSELSDVELDQIVCSVLNEFPNTGYKSMQGHLRAKGLRVTEREVRGSMRRVDPTGVLERTVKLKVLRRRTYRVGGPLRLMHIDGHHKLIS